MDLNFFAIRLALWKIYGESVSQLFESRVEKQKMKKKTVIPVIAIIALVILSTGYYFMPRTFGKNINPSEVDHINVFDGSTGTGFTITNPEDIKYIVENIQNHPMKKNGVSLGKMGYSFKISYVDSNDKDIISVFILNSDNLIRKDPFFYACDGGLCFDYIRDCEEIYKTNITDVSLTESKNIAF